MADLHAYLETHPSHEPVLVKHLRDMLKALEALYGSTD